VSNTNSKTVES